jgi:hypothetical protein
MTRFSLCATVVAVTALAASPSADARTNRLHGQTAAIAGAHNNATDENGIRQKCYEQANSTWRSSNQEMQTVRDYAYRTCAFDHGLRKP